MKQIRVVLLSLLMVLLCNLFSAAQQSVATATNATVPPLIPFSSVATDEGGNSLSGVVGITFSLYVGPQGGEPLWTETQNNVQLDPTGHYSVQLGITKPNGVPTTLFTTGEARWLGVRIAEQGEQPRVLLLSVPYALKAGDAATIGGLPPSAFVLAAPPFSSTSGSAAAAPLDASATTQTSAPPPTGTPVTGTGTVNFLPLWDTTSDIISSVLFQSGTGATAKVGINTTTPATTLDVKGAGTIRGTLSLPATGTATATKGANSQPLNLAASSFSSTTGKAVAQTFQWQAEPAGNDTAADSGTLNLLFGAGTSKPAETGLNIASTGVITFNAAQTFPNTITGVTTATGSGLTGGGVSGTLNLGLLNTCTTNQVLQWDGTAWACATVGGGSGSGTVTSVATGLGLLGGPIITSGTLTIDPTVVPQLGTANTFTGNQTVMGNVIATTGYEIQFAGTNRLFDYGTPFAGSGLGNSFLGFAGNSTMTGQGNVGAGWAALAGNTIGFYNTAVGLQALFTNSSGQQNTAVGQSALFANGGDSSSTANANTAIGYGAASSNTTGYSNTAIGAQSLYRNTGGVYNTAVGGLALLNNTGTTTTGDYNTALGYASGPTTANLSNTTAIGANASVSESNALVLGGTGANAVKVGIGTAAPAYTLDAAGTIRSSSGGFMFPDGTTQTTAAAGGGGTITGVTAGTGLTGGGTSGNVTLSINAATIPQLGTANTFTTSQTVNGTLAATSSSTGVLGSATATTGNASGVLGESQSTSGYGIQGLATAATGTTYGVYGGTISPAGYGVYGQQFAATGTAAGAYGTTASTAGYGVEGVNTSTSGTGVYGTANQYGVQGVATGSGTTVGVYGTGKNGLQGKGTATGVSGNGTAAGSTGVYGTGQSFGVQAVGTAAGSTGAYGTAPQYGLQGVATGSSGSTAGVFGTGANGLQGAGTFYGVYGAGTAADSTGVYGTGSAYGLQAVATNTTNPSTGVYATGNLGLWGIGTQYGVYSETAAGTAGVYGVYQDPSVTGAQYDWGAAVWADTNLTLEVGDLRYALLATADDNIAGAFKNNSGTIPTVDAVNLGSGGTGDVIHAEGTGGSCTLTGGGDAACTGTLKSVVATTTSEGAQRVETYAVQSAENWFEDAGTAQLVNGSGRVNLESVFGQTVNTGVEYHVFLTPDGDCKGLYVSAKTASGFEVRELGGGASSIAFEYRIMAKRVGYENVRLADVTERFNKQEAQSMKMRRPTKPSAAPQSRPKMPPPPALPVRAAVQPLAAQPK
jgi:hypothetical protein